MVTDQKFLYVGSGDGRIKKLEGYDTQWVQLTETQLAGKVTSLSITADQREILAGT